MDNKLFIPKKIKVGYVHRNDTYTKKLAYVIYYDEKGKLRKETSWEKWRDKSIPSEEFENKPHNGFVINKDVQRSSDWFGSGRNMIRVYDDRGIEFEITCDNLIHILMESNCVKRGLEGEYVYAWQGKELVLLPTNSMEYTTAKQYTELKSKKVKAKELIAGCSYKTKDMEDIIYLGKFDYYTFRYENNSYLSPRVRSAQNMFIFTDSNKNLKPLLNINSLAVQNTNTPITDYAEYMQVFSDSEFSSPIEQLISESNYNEFNKFINQYEIGKEYEIHYYQGSNFFIKKDENTYVHININPEIHAEYLNSVYIRKFIGFKVSQYGIITNVNNNFKIENSFERKELSGGSISIKKNLFSNRENYFNHEDLRKLNIVSIFVLFKNGKKIPIQKIL